MTVGLGLLRLPQKDFWGMTPREFERAAAAVLPQTAAPLRRGDLRVLMAAFPDQPQES